MIKYLIITAGGIGKRMGSEIPKQFIELNGRPVILHTIDRFLEYDNELNIILVLPANHFEAWNEICLKHNFTRKLKIVHGGRERFNSVKNGLTETRPGALVAIHDAVRPLVSTDTIKRCFNMASKEGSAVPFIKPPESVREEFKKGENKALNRDTIRLIQTPQIFHSDLLIKAYDCEVSPGFTDDATVVERLGEKIQLVAGNKENIKITTPLDLKIAETLLSD